MATDYAEMEREFLASLEADTGHDLAGWMTLIDRQGLNHRNDIIDWLRTQRFQFSWASWLERIHHNGGRPIYNLPADIGPGPAIRSSTERSPQAAPALVAKTPAIRQAEPAPPGTPPPVPLAPLAPVLPAASGPAGSLNELLAKAKAYRMLAEHLLRETRRAIPDVTITARGSYVSLARAAEFAALSISPKELRLGLALGEAGATDLPRGRMTGTAAPISHLVVLTDARQINPPLIDAIRQADRGVNGG